MASVLDKIQKIPLKTRAFAFGGVVFALIVLFIWQVQIPKKNQIQTLESEISGLQVKIRDNDAKIQKLDELKAEVVALQRRLVILTEQLPPESEVSGLLLQIQQLVNQAGLSLKKWIPKPRKKHQTGLYEEIPITLDIVGGYHSVAGFFDRVGKLTRIVNIGDVKMGSAKQNRGGAMDIAVTCTATTFAAVEKKGEEAKPDAKKGR